jgi:hypothetical protein
MVVHSAEYPDRPDTHPDIRPDGSPWEEGDRFIDDTDPRHNTEEFVDGEWVNISDQNKAKVKTAAKGFTNVVGNVAGTINNGALNGAFNANQDTEEAGRLKNQADILHKNAGRQEADAQRNLQIANRDPRVEGQAKAASRAASQFNQTQSQISGAAGGGAAALAAMNVQDPSADISEYTQRADAQHVKGVESMDKAGLNEIHAERNMAAAANKNLEARDVKAVNTQGRVLATQEPDKPPVKEQPATEQVKPQDQVEEVPLPKEDVAAVAEKVGEDVTEQNDPEANRRVLNAIGDIPEDSKVNMRTLYKQGIIAYNTMVESGDRLTPEWQAFQKAVADAGAKTTVGSSYKNAKSIETGGAAQFDNASEEAKNIIKGNPMYEKALARINGSPEE